MASPSRSRTSWPRSAPSTPINEWIYQKEGATIDTPTNLEAAQHLQQWIEAGYFPEDVNAIEYADSNARFAQGEGVFTFNGDWQNGGYDTDAPGNVGFFLFPPAEEGGVHGSMGVPVTFGIAANAKNADCAAFFLNWVGTDPAARQINVTVAGSSPVGPADLPLPEVPEGSVTNDTLAAGAGRRGRERRDGLHRQRDRRRSSPRAGRPSSRRWSAASRRPKVCSRRSRPPTRRISPSDISRRSGGMKADEAFPLPGRRGEPCRRLRCGPRAGAGSAAAGWAGWLFVLPALIAYAAFVLVPLRHDRPVLDAALERHRATRRSSASTTTSAS